MESESELTEEQKQKECERICGESGKQGIHRMAPEMCPYKWQEWKNPPKRKLY